MMKIIKPRVVRDHLIEDQFQRLQRLAGLRNAGDWYNMRNLQRYYARLDRHMERKGKDYAVG